VALRSGDRSREPRSASTAIILGVTLPSPQRLQGAHRCRPPRVNHRLRSWRQQVRHSRTTTLRLSDGHPDADADGLGLRGNLASAHERFRPLNVLGAHFRFGDQAATPRSRRASRRRASRRPSAWSAGVLPSPPSRGRAVRRRRDRNGRRARAKSAAGLAPAPSCGCGSPNATGAFVNIEDVPTVSRFSGSRSRRTTTTMAAQTSMPGTRMEARESGSTRSRSSTAALAGSSGGWFSHGRSFIARSCSITGRRARGHETLNKIQPLQ
jgi:hypothetical protein